MKVYLTELEKTRQAQYRIFNAIMCLHGYGQKKEHAQLIGIKPNTYVKRCAGDLLQMDIAELKKVADRVGLSREEISSIVLGTMK